MAYLYILYSKKIDKFYVGACLNLERRIYEHNIGHSKFTKTGVPWALMYTEEFETLQQAKERERQVKKRKSRIYIDELIKQNG